MLQRGRRHRRGRQVEGVRRTERRACQRAVAQHLVHAAAVSARHEVGVITAIVVSAVGPAASATAVQSSAAVGDVAGAVVAVVRDAQGI